VSPARAALLLGLLIAAAPARAALRDDVEALRADVRDLETRLLELQQGQEAILARLDEMRRQLGLDQPGRRSPADLDARLASLDDDMRVLFERHNETSTKLSVLADRVAALYRQQAQIQAAQATTTAPGPVAAEPPVPTPPASAAGAPGGPRAVAEGRTSPDAPAPGGVAARPAAGAAPGPSPLVDPEELYQEARADYGRGSYQMAIAGFREFLDRFSDSELADNAQYWIAESYYADGLHEQALEEFTRVLERHPGADKVPDAEYKRALCLLELNRTADGILQLQAVKDRHPDTPAARLARQKLEALGLM
jgi:tol-pal system protein YbgF